MSHANTHTPLHGPTGGVPSDKALSDIYLHSSPRTPRSCGIPVPPDNLYSHTVVDVCGCAEPLRGMRIFDIVAHCSTYTYTHNGSQPLAL
eukprot:scaffold5706_cov124-Isochrysis_galbana.AAC.2